MKNYKLHTGLQEIYKITSKYDFEEKTGSDKNYRYVGDDGITRGLAVCPSCDNPIRILGFYKKLDGRKPYAQHHNKSTNIAVFDKSAYLHCPNSNPGSKRQWDKSSSKRQLSNYEKELYNIMRNNFDKVISFLNNKLSLYISCSTAERFLKEFVINSGCTNPDASIYNLPYILLLTSSKFNVVKMRVKKHTKLWNFIYSRNINGIKLTSCHKLQDNIESNYDIIDVNCNKYILLQCHFIKHVRYVNKEDEIIEKIEMRFSDSNKIPVNWIYKENISIDQESFPNYCKKINYGNKNLLEIAKKIMPPI